VTLHINYLMYRMLPYDGYGRFGQSQIKALMRAGVDVYPDHVIALEAPGWMQRLKGLDFSRLTISLMPPHEMKALPSRQWLSTMYEGTGLPDDWGAHINQKAERVIVPSAWLIDVFRAHGVRKHIPIDVVPGGVEVDEFPLLTRPVPTDRPYTFLAFGDRGSRKGSDVAWQAFYRAFGDSQDVRLVIKTLAFGLADLCTAGGDRRVSVWRETTPSLADVFPLADCFVFPTRGEGWALPPREAACMGLPVICTRWSGAADGIDHWAIPIDTVTLVNSRLRGGGQWAQPDVDEVAMHMRWCYEHREEARQKGHQAAAWLRDHQTWDHSARALIALLETWG
jgi:glycosyltransferase involved in cell wall biosynthesis